MISSLAVKLANSGFTRLAEFILKMGVAIVGSNVKIRFKCKNCWTHYKESWIINEVVPDIRFDPERQVSFIKDVQFKHYLPSGEDVFIDLGSGIGMESIFLSRQTNFHGKIYAIEASPFTFGLLKTNIQSNHLKNIQLFNVAISDRNGEIFIDDDHLNHISNSVFTEKGIPVNTITMDGFMEENQIETVALLKVNIEGAERLLIGSFEKISKVKHVAISCHDFLFKRSGNKHFITKKSVVRFLENRNFDVIGNDTGIDYVDDWIYGTNRMFHSPVIT
jgi:FkbM family methyltransferase